jgi:hypothetical protein
MVSDEPLKFIIISHKKGRYEFARTPPVNVRSPDWVARAEVLGNVLDTEVLLNTC